METIYTTVHALFKSVPEMAFFLSLALGYLVGKINFGKFQLGGVAGSLLMAVIVSQFGVHIDDTVKNILFALFIFAVGFTSGPMFFRSLNKKSFREIVLSAVLAVTGLITVVVLARMFSLDKGLAAGIAAGGLTQSAIMGTANPSTLSRSAAGTLETMALKPPAAKDSRAPSAAFCSKGRCPSSLALACAKRAAACARKDGSFNAARRLMNSATE